MRKAVRLATPAAIAAAALILTGCGSDSKDDDAKGNDSQQESTTGGGDDAADDADDAADDAPAGEAPSAAELEGWWTADLSGAEANTLIFSAEEATMAVPLSGDEADLCNGTVTDGTVTLECLLGSDFTEGTLALDGDTLQVAWSSGTTETYNKIPGLEDLDLGDLGGDMGGLDLDF
ncbi:hypothetical protein ACFC1B_16490 [Streptomyces xiamenensis]|uniref:hypothetical protein n=1 Tax=Streptomyces xiamenensis TaxID=408015 RepID=UPI0035E1DD86